MIVLWLLNASRYRKDPCYFRWCFIRVVEHVWICGAFRLLDAGKKDEYFILSVLHITADAIKSDMHIVRLWMRKKKE